MSEIIQGSDEWRKVRLGKVTASRIPDLIAKTKTGWGASRANYMADLMVERLTGVPADGFTSAAMLWGTEQEPNARAAYEFHNLCEVGQIGFVHHPEIADSGASPDGLVGAKGLVEIKCPNSATHIDTLLGKSVPGKYVSQIQWQLRCTDRDWCDFVSFDPRMPTNMQLFIQRVERDDKAIADIEKSVREFLDEMAKKLAQLIAANQKEAA